MHRLPPQLLVAAFALFIGADPVLTAGTPLVRAEMHAGRPAVHVLSWDTEGGRRAGTNLLRSGKPLGLRVKVDGQWKQGSEFPASPEPAPAKSTSYRLAITPQASLLWSSSPASDSLTMTFSLQGPGSSQVESVEVLFPFDPGVTPVSVLPSQWTDDGSLRLPAVISAPDFGQMLLADSGKRRLKARLEGSRSNKTVDFSVELPALGPGAACVLNLTPVWLPAPKGLVDQALWEKVRWGWFGALQPSARWGEQDRPFSAPAGILANNVISDPASCSLWFYADQALWTPQITADISAAALVRRSIDWWLDHRTRPTGEVVGYWDYGNFLDANAGPLLQAVLLREPSFRARYYRPLGRHPSGQ